MNRLASNPFSKDIDWFKNLLLQAPQYCMLLKGSGSSSSIKKEWLHKELYGKNVEHVERIRLLVEVNLQSLTISNQKREKAWMPKPAAVFPGWERKGWWGETHTHTHRWGKRENEEREEISLFLFFQKKKVIPISNRILSLFNLKRFGRIRKLKNI